MSYFVVWLGSFAVIVCLTLVLVGAGVWMFNRMDDLDD